MQDFDLSRNKSLRTLEVLAPYILDRKLGFFGHVLPTISSHVSLKVVIVYRDYDFPGLQPGSHPRAGGASCHRMQFCMFRKMHRIRNFRLELRADVWGGVEENAVQVLRRAVAAQNARRGFSDTGIQSPVRAGNEICCFLPALDPVVNIG